MKLSLATLLLLGSSSALSLKSSFVWDEKEQVDLEKMQVDSEIQKKKDDETK